MIWKPYTEKDGKEYKIYMNDMDFIKAYEKNEGLIEFDMDEPKDINDVFERFGRITFMDLEGCYDLW